MSYLLDTAKYVAHVAERLEPECYLELQDEEVRVDTDLMPNNFTRCDRCAQEDPEAAPASIIWRPLEVTEELPVLGPLDLNELAIELARAAQDELRERMQINAQDVGDLSDLRAGEPL